MDMASIEGFEAEDDVVVKAKPDSTKADFSVSDAKETDDGSVHGIVANVSPMKKGKGASFFEVKLSNGKGGMRVVGFAPSQREKLEKFKEESSGVALHNCKVKCARLSEELEIMLHPISSIQHSPKKFKVDEALKMGAPCVSVGGISDRRECEKVCINAKVVRVFKPARVFGGLTKQDVILADAGCSVKLTLWEKSIGCVEKDKTYRFSDVVVRTYLQSKHLSMSKEGASITQIDDIGDVGVQHVRCEDNSISISFPRNASQSCCLTLLDLFDVIKRQQESL